MAESRIRMVNPFSRHPAAPLSRCRDGCAQREDVIAERPARDPGANRDQAWLV
jgi:hypothetical protein